MRRLLTISLSRGLGTARGAGLALAVVLGLGSGLAVSTASAQELPRATVSVLGGGTLPVSDAADAMGLGWNVGVAASVRMKGGLGLRADYLYSRFGAKTETWDVLMPWDELRRVPVHAKSQMHAVSLDLQWTQALEQGRRAYVMAGPTFFRRRVRLTGEDVQGITDGCEAQWLQCSAGTIGFDRALGIKEEDDLGCNFGAGFSVGVGLNALLTVEARYYYVRGPVFHAADGRARRASAQFVPVSVGLTF